LVYNLVAGFDYIQEVAVKHYDKETDPVNKRLIALIGYNTHPTSAKWKKRFLDTFPRTEKEGQETFAWESTPPGGNFLYIGGAMINTLSNIAIRDKKALALLFDAPVEGIFVDKVCEEIYKVANNSPRYFLRELKQLPKEDRDSILGHLAFGSDDDNFNGPFKKELELLIKKKDKELGDFAAYCLKYIEKSIKEINNPQ
jgi:hypothetical protein